MFMLSFRRAVLCFGVLFCVGLSACAPEFDWRTVQPESAAGLQAMFPCKPDAHQRRVSLPGVSVPVTLHLLSCQRADATWALSYATVADPREVAPALEGLLAALRQNLSMAAKLAHADEPAAGVDLGKVTVPRMTPHPLAHTWSFATVKPDGQGKSEALDVRAWQFTHGLTVFQATVWRPAAAAKAKGSDELMAPFSGGFQFPG